MRIRQLWMLSTAWFSALVTLFAVVTIGTSNLNDDRQFAAENLLVICACVMVGGHAAAQLWRQYRADAWRGVFANLRLIGDLVAAVGMGTNRGYWLTFRSLRIAGDYAGAAWFEAIAQPIGTASLLVFTIGLLLGYSMTWRRRFGPAWAVLIVSGAVLVWLIGYMLPDIFGAHRG